MAVFQSVSKSEGLSQGARPWAVQRRCACDWRPPCGRVKNRPIFSHVALHGSAAAGAVDASKRHFCLRRDEEARKSPVTWHMRIICTSWHWICSATVLPTGGATSGLRRQARVVAHVAVPCTESMK